MKIGFYLKLAWQSMCKNKRLYKPYILTCIGMVIMYYIITCLGNSPFLVYLPGADSLVLVLSLGSWVIAIFAAIFLFYTNSFLMRRRKKEFGLYNILGMGKRNIGCILFWEVMIVILLALGVGLTAGIAFSKFAELGLVNMLQADISYDFYLSTEAVVSAVKIFLLIFLLIFLSGLWQIGRTNAVALLHSEKSGEKPPKANWFLGLAGAVLLGIAYYIAVSIEQPLTALAWFFVAVLLVIIGTYLLFIAGSVLVCRILQKNKRYYYKLNHFVSVASMTYRMKRNGAGLASICILGTMVLVMLASSACLYFGMEDSMRIRYPKDIAVDICLNGVGDAGDENIALLRNGVETVISDNGAEVTRLMDYCYAQTTGVLRDGVLETDIRALEKFGLETYDELCQVYLIPLSDYNELMGANEQLSADQTMIYTVRNEYFYDTLTIRNGATYHITKVLDEFVGNGNAAMDVLPSIFLIVPDFQAAMEPLMNLEDYNGMSMVRLHWYYGFDMKANVQMQISMAEQIRGAYRQLSYENVGGIYSYSCESLEENREDFYSIYGGLFFLGLILSIVFIFAAVLIIYYKQISEGYEDQERFEIMQKVGMTKRDIRKSINSQMLTVFFLPLVTAVVHLAFAFPMLRKVLLLFNLVNVKLLLVTAGVCVLIFAVFYMLVYRITSNTYYNIVSGVKEA